MNQKPRKKKAEISTREKRRKGDECQHPRPGVEQEVRTENSGYRAAGPYHGHARGRLEPGLGQLGSRTAEQVEDQVRAVPEPVFHVIAENIQIEHVPNQMQPPSVEEHGRYECPDDGEGQRAAEQRFGHRRRHYGMTNDEPVEAGPSESSYRKAPAQAAMRE